jgi:surface antigen
MTEREIPDSLGFLFGGMTDGSNHVSAPPDLSEPEKLLAAAPAPTGAPVYSSRREARAAGAFSADAAAPAPAPATPAAAPTAPAYDGIASLFPLLGDVTVSPVESPLPTPSAFDAILAPADLATQAMPIAEVVAELATPVAPYVVLQSGPVSITSVSIAPVAITPVSITPLLITPVSTVPPVAAPAQQTPSWHVADSFGLAASVPQADPFVTSRRARRAAVPAQPSGRQKKLARDKRTSHDRVDRHIADRTAADHKPLRQRAFGVAVMVLVGGLFAVLALPAYADNNASSLTAAAAVQTQTMDIAQTAASTVSAASRDGYTATSAADLKKLYSDAIREQNLTAYLQSGAKAQGDDYPWYAELSRNQGGGLSPLNYYYRECVDFVAWRLNRDQGSVHAPFKWTWSTLTPSGGNASQWKSAWLNHGWATGTTPAVGAVAWFPTNHLSYVSGILNNGDVLLEEYNWGGQHIYGTRVISPGDAYYLYAPPA